MTENAEGVKGTAAASFEELHIYQRARELTNAVYSISREGAFGRDLGLADQIRRASVSIMSNIAEGFERGSSTEFIQFLFVAKGSCGEVRAQLQVANDQQYISGKENARLNDLCRRISGMISNFIGHLQASDYRGEKFTRPRRLAVQAADEELVALRAAQVANTRATELRKAAETRLGEPT